MILNLQYPIANYHECCTFGLSRNFHNSEIPEPELKYLTIIIFLPKMYGFFSLHSTNYVYIAMYVHS